MNLNDRKMIVFEGNVKEVVDWINDKVGKHETLSLRDYFEGQDVYGIYVEGEERFRFYYECTGNGKYTIFVMMD